MNQRAIPRPRFEGSEAYGRHVTGMFLNGFGDHCDGNTTLLFPAGAMPYEWPLFHLNSAKRNFRPMKMVFDLAREVEPSRL